MDVRDDRMILKDKEKGRNKVQGIDNNPVPHSYSSHSMLPSPKKVACPLFFPSSPKAAIREDPLVTYESAILSEVWRDGMIHRWPGTENKVSSHQRIVFGITSADRCRT